MKKSPDQTSIPIRAAAEEIHEVNHGCRSHLHSQVTLGWLWKNFRLALLLAACGWLGLWRAEASGTWTALAHAPQGGVNNSLLMSDGTVICGGAEDQNWYQLTPDIHGSYVNGTWTQIASTTYSRLFFSSDVLTNGNVYVCGGEDGNGGNYAELYDSLANTWTVIPGTSGVFFSDAASKILPNGNVLQSDSQSAYYIYNTASNILTFGGSCGDMNETCWVRLPNDNILAITGYSTNSEHYVPSLNQWHSDGHVPVSVFGFGGELGPALVLPNGKVFQIGATTNTAIYTPGSTLTSGGTWVAGPTMMNGTNGLGAVDAPAAMMVNGKILCALCVATNFSKPTYFYEYDYVANSFTQVNGPHGTTENNFPYATSMLDLPDGSVLFINGQGTTSLYVYKPDGTPLAAGQPMISSITENMDGSYHLTGTNLTGITGGAAYGDDEQMDSSYPLVRMTNSVSGNVYYARTYQWSSTTIQNTNPVTTEFSLPLNLPAGTYSLVVTANGNASAPTNFTYAPPPTPTGLTAASGSNAFVNLQWNASSGATAYNVKQATNSGGYFATIATISGTAYTNTGLFNGLTYYYKVAAVGSGGAGTNSGFVSATPAGPPQVPINLTAISGDNSMVPLTWSSFGATNYNVKRSTTSGAETTVATTSANNYTDTGLTNGTTYYYVVSAVNASGESSNSIEVAATPAPAVTLTATDANGTSSFNAAGHWSNGSAPALTSDYLDSGFVLRTPGSANDYTFAGHSLTLNSGAVLALKNDGHTTTIGSSAITGLSLDNAAVQIFDSGSADTVAGYLTLLPGGGGFSPDNGTLTISAIISGSGSLSVNNAGTIILSGTNNYTGGTSLNAADTLTFPAGASGASSSLQLISGSLCQVLTTLPVLATNATVSISGQLFLTNGVNMTIGNLLLNGVVQTNGTWGSSSSVAINKNDIYFGGAGVLTVGSNSISGSVNPTNLFWTGSGIVTSLGGGTWNTTAGNNVWNNGVGTTGNTSWSAAASATNAVFGGADGTFGINVGANVGVKRLIFQNSGVTLSNTTAPETITFSAGGSIPLPNVYVETGRIATIGTNVTLTLNATFILGGAGTLIVDNGGTVQLTTGSTLSVDSNLTVSVKSGGAFKMTTTSTGGNLQIGASAGENSTVSVDGGTVSIAGSNQGILIGQKTNSIGTLTVNSGTVSLAAANTVGALSVGATASPGGGTGTVNLNGGLLLVNRVNTLSGNTGTFNFNGGTLKPVNNTFAATFMTNLTAVNVLAGGAVIDNNSFAITIGQALLHSLIDSPIDGGLTSLGAGTLTLTNANTYNGNTTISAGTLALSGSGSISNSTQIIITSGTTLDVSARTDQTLTLNNGQTLTGSGNLKGKLLVASGATVNPGDTIGTLTVQSNIVLNGTVVLELNRTNTQTSDKLTSTGTITGGGTLTVTNLGPALQVGNTFQLFSQAVGGFTTVNLPAGYLWANNLGSNGTIQVTTVVSTSPTNITLQATSNSLALSWPLNHTTWRLQSATNLFGGWVDVAGSTATNSVLIPVYPTNASLFFRLVYP